MKRYVLCFMLLCGVLMADSNDDATINRVINCNAIFEERKTEIISEIREIEEQKRLMTSLYEEQQVLNDKKLQEIKLQEQTIQALLKEAQDKENAIKELIKQNEELLATIQNAKSGKISDTYAKMNDSKAGAIIDNMPLIEAAELLNSMDSKNISRILAKVTPQRAAKLTEMLRKGPPFDEYE